MGRTVVAMIKKFWILAVVFTLALSLTSCSSGKGNYSGGNSGLDCSGPKDSFYVEIVQGSGSAYDLVLTPTQVSTEGVLAQIALLGDTVNQLQVKENMVTLYTGLPIHISVTLDDLQNFRSIGVGHMNLNQPNQAFTQMAAGAICQLPLPGDGYGAKGY